MHQLKFHLNNDVTLNSPGVGAKEEKEDSAWGSDVLPNNWRKYRLKEIGKLLRGVSYRKEESSSQRIEDFVPVLRATNIQDEKLILDNELVYVPAKYVKPEQYLQQGDIVICMSSGSKHLVGKTAQLNQQWKGSFGTFCTAIRPGSNINKTFIGYFFLSPDYREFIRKKSVGININNLRPADIENVEILLPPLAEQHRIVARIEEIFTQIDAGVASLRRAQAGLKRYKAAVLKAACEGRLVAQDDGDEPATEHLRRILGDNYHEKIALSKEISIPSTPTGWVYGKLESLIYIAGRIGWRGLKADEYISEGPMILSVYNLNKGDVVDFSKVHHISQQRYDESPEIMLRENDIVLAKDGAGIGKIGIVKNLPQQATVNSSLLVIRANQVFVPEFLFYFLKGPQMQDIVKQRITGSATPHLFQRDIRRFTLLIPPHAEQQRIVAEVERRLSVAQEVEKAVEAGLARAARLRQAVLKAAFEGRLL